MTVLLGMQQLGPRFDRSPNSIFLPEPKMEQRLMFTLLAHFLNIRLQHTRRIYLHILPPPYNIIWHPNKNTIIQGKKEYLLGRKIDIFDFYLHCFK